MTTTGPMALSDRVATLEEAKAQFREKVGRLESLGEAGRGSLGEPGGGGEMLFYVRGHTCADGAFERYVLVIRGGARAYSFRRERRLQRSGRSCRRSSIWPRQSHARIELSELWQEKTPLRRSRAKAGQQWRGSFVRRPVDGDPRLRFPTGFGQIKPRLDRGDQRGFSALGVFGWCQVV